MNLFRSKLVGALAATSMLLVGCLGPTDIDPTGTAPTGRLDGAKDVGGAIRITGWARDPDTSKPIVVKAGVDGVVKTFTANGPRPGKTNGHGYSYEFELDPGKHDICVWVPNTVGRGEDRFLGCKTKIVVTSPNPVGKLESATSPAPATIAVSGYAYDRDYNDPIHAVLQVDGEFSAKVEAKTKRSGVAIAPTHPSSSIGFSTELSVTPGTHRVCLHVLNKGRGSNLAANCKTVTVAGWAADDGPSGTLSEVTAVGDQLSVSGTASDPDGGVGLEVQIVAESTDVLRETTVAVEEGEFDASIAGMAPGVYSVCTYAQDVNGGSEPSAKRELACGSAVFGDKNLGSASPAGNGRVAASGAHRLTGVVRDAGISVQLGDGSVMWFFGDTSEVDSLGRLQYFVNNTAAWAAPDSPTVTQDGSTGGKPNLFVAAPSTMCRGAKYPSPALWPESAVAIPQEDGTDRVIVYMSKVCLGNGWLQIEGRGMAAVEVIYDPANPPANKRIAGRILKTDFASAEKPLGRAAVYGGDGYVYAQHCERFDPTNLGPRSCYVARALTSRVANPSHWFYWNGGDPTSEASWGAEADASPMVMADGSFGGSIPVAGFSVVFDPAYGAFVMVYTPWPGFTDRVEVRVAESPVGPWSSPATIMLPGCNDSHGSARFNCYAGTPQPALSGDGQLGIGYYDQLSTTVPARGQYMWATVPFAVSP